MPRRRRRDYYSFFHYESTRPQPVRDGVKARSQRGQIGRSWWAKRWIEALERLVDPKRLTRGRSYARKGQVIDLQATAHGIEARVQGSRSRPYKITIALEPLDDAAWERVADQLAGQALFSARLLAGEMPDDIEAAFGAAGVNLFPDRPGQLVTTCSCPDWANPCKHVAAVHYILGERFDEDPFLLFRLRGRTREQLLDDLRRRRASASASASEDDDAESGAVEPAGMPLETTIDRFWTVGEALEPFPLHIAPSDVRAPVLKRLGQPAFLTVPLELTLGPVLAAAARRAVDSAFREVAPQPDDGT
jgi:uncharacterized Zn finger protein